MHIMTADEQKEARLKALADPDSDYFRGVDAFMVSMVAQAAGVGGGEKRGVLKLPCAVPGGVLSKLEKQFSVQLRCVPRVASKQPLALNVGWLADQRLESLKSWDGEDVVALDGDAAAVVARRKEWWHVCRSHSSTALLSRYSDEDETLRRMLDGKNRDLVPIAARMLDALRGGEDKRSGCCEAAVCSWRADTLVVNTLVVAPAPVQVAGLLQNHGAVRAKMWFYFETAMLYQDYGELSSMPGSFVRDDERDAVYIIPAEGYGRAVASYKWSVLRAFALGQTVSWKGKRYFSEVVDRVDGIIFVMFTTAEGKCESGTVMERALATGEGTMVRVTQRMFLPKETCPGAEPPEVSALVREDWWNDAAARLYSVPIQKLTVAEARVAVADFSQQRVASGFNFKAPLPIAYDMPEFVAQALWKFVTMERLRMETESEVARGEVTRAWADAKSGLFPVMLRAMWDKAMAVGDCMLSMDTLLRESMGFSTRTIARDYEVRVEKCDEHRVWTEYAGPADDECGELMGSAGLLYGFPGWTTTASVSTNSETNARTMKKAEMLATDVREAEALFATWDVEEDMRECIVEEVRSVKKSGHRDLPADKEDVVVKMHSVTGEATTRPVERLETRYVTASRETLPDDDAEVANVVDVLQEGYTRMFPLCASVDSEVRPYVSQQADKSFVFETPGLRANGAKDKLPEPRAIRRSKLRTGVSGKLPVTQAAAMSAFSKRVCNAPNYAQPSVYADRLRSDFEKFARVALKDGWRDRVNAAVEAGLWDFDEQQVRSYVAGMASSTVGKVLAEDFRTANVDMTRWTAMVKSTAKPKMSESVYFSESAPQTIVYQESKVTNSWFSMKLGKFHDLLDQELRSNVRINARRDKADTEEWHSSLVGVYRKENPVLVETDISQCDKSQQLYNMLMFFYVLEQFGAPEYLVDVWKVMLGKKRASASSVGVLVEYLYQVVSGFFGTISANSLVVAVANVVCLDLEPENVVSFEQVGDDGSLALKRLTRTAVEIAESFRDNFNFEAKVFMPVDPYICSTYQVYFGNRCYDLKDPVKVIEGLGRSVSSTADLRELWESFKDTLRGYGNSGLMDALDEAVQRRFGKGSVRAQLRALGQLRRSYESFESLFSTEIDIVS